jgi:hypothetical protein
MRTFVLVALLATGLLIFGCTYSANYNYNASANGSAAMNESGSVPSEPSMNETAPPMNESSPAMNTTEQPAMNESGAMPSENATGGEAMPSGDVTGKTYEDLLMGGVPAKCTLTVHEDAGDRNLVLYFDGNGNMTADEASTGLADCPSAVMVYKGDIANGGKLYASCPGHTDMLGKDFETDNPCAWHSMDVLAEYGGLGSSSLGFGFENESYSTPSLDSAQASDYSCQPWTVDASKFDLNGFVCS